MAVTCDKLGRYGESAGYLENYLKLDPGAKDAAELLAKVRAKIAGTSTPAQKPSQKPPLGASILVSIGAALLIADIGTAAAGYSLGKQVEAQPLNLAAYQEAEAQGQRLNQASAALLAVGLSVSLAGATWHLVAYGRQQRTP